MLPRAPLLGLLALLAAAGARAEAVDVELVLAVDVSRSVDEAEAALQRDGYVAAFRNPRVIEAVQSGAIGAIAVTYVEWAGAAYQQVIVPWVRVGDAEAGQALADAIDAAPRIAANWTSVSAAIDFAAALFPDNGFEGTRLVIDISGDGRTNQGRSTMAARDEAVAAGIAINGLAILNDRPNFSRPPEADLDRWYEENVIGGPGAFLVVAEDFGRFGAALLAKLIREIAGRQPPADADQSASASVSPVRMRTTRPRS